MQGVRRALHRQDRAAGAEHAAAGPCRQHNVQTTQLGHPLGFLAAAQHHVVTGGTVHHALMLVQPKGKAGGVPIRGVFQQ